MNNINKPTKLSIKSHSLLKGRVIVRNITVKLALLALIPILLTTIILVRQNTTANAESTDTGSATLSSLALDYSDNVPSPDKTYRITSVTIDDTTLTEGLDTDATSSTYGYYKILNNNTVNYTLNLNVTTPGTITVTFTLPANNTIDSSSISTAAGCQDGSKLQSATVDGVTSYTNNQAICILNPTTTGTTSLTIKANPWGSTGTIITPAITIGDDEQAVEQNAESSVGVMGKLNYEVYFMAVSYNDYYATGYNNEASTDFALYTPNNDDGVVGVEPLVSYEVVFDMSAMPVGWLYKEGSGYTGCGYYQSLGFGLTEIKPFTVTCAQNTDNNTLAIQINDMVTATMNYVPTSKWGYIYMKNGVKIMSPVSSLTSTSQKYVMSVASLTGRDAAGMVANLNAATNYMQYYLSNDYAFTTALYSTDPLMTWHGNESNTTWNSLVVDREQFGLSMVISQLVNYNAEVTEDINACFVWDANYFNLAKEVDRNIASGISGVSYQYGVADSTSTSDKCGIIGDGSTSFFDSLSDAQLYASENNLTVDAIRVHISSAKNVTLARFGDVTLLPVSAGKSDIALYATSSLSATSVKSYSTTIYDGVLSNKVLATPSESNPNTEEHIAITPISYGVDTNAKITVALPSGLNIKAGSFKQGETTLAENTDYTITTNNDSTTTIVFDMDTLSLDKTIEFNTLISPSTPTPTTLTITSTTSGTGTDYASTTFKTKTTTIQVASPPKTFGYGLTTYVNNQYAGTASTIYASDNLTYNYQVTNTTDNDATNLSLISVLPYNGDSRGTTGISSYTTTMDSTNLASLIDSGSTIYYTTDTKARTYENSTDSTIVSNLNVDAEDTGSSEEGITWTELTIEEDSSSTSSTPTTITLPVDTTAIKVAKSTLASNDTINLSLTLTDITPEESSSSASSEANTGTDTQPVLAGDITYITYDTVDSSSTTTTTTSSAIHQNKTTTTYLGDLLSLSLDTDTIEATIEANSETTKEQTVTLTTKTLKGYNLTMSMESNTTNSLTSTTSTNQTTIPSLSTKPEKGTTGWSIKLADNANSTVASTWQQVPTKTNALSLKTGDNGNQSTKLTNTFGFSTNATTTADTYKGVVVYTLTAGI